MTGIARWGRFRRTAVALLAGTAVGVFWTAAPFYIPQLGQLTLRRVLLNCGIDPRWVVAIDGAVFYTLIPVAAALVVHALIRKHLSSPIAEESRCRRCGYILRGLPEPRCPECGERI